MESGTEKTKYKWDESEKRRRKRVRKEIEDVFIWDTFTHKILDGPRQ